MQSSIILISSFIWCKNVQVFILKNVTVTNTDQNVVWPVGLVLTTHSVTTSTGAVYRGVVRDFMVESVMKVCLLQLNMVHHLIKLIIKRIFMGWSNILSHSALTNRELVPVLSVHGEHSSQLFTSGTSFPSSINSEHFWYTSGIIRIATLVKVW